MILKLASKLVIGVASVLAFWFLLSHTVPVSDRSQWPWKKATADTGVAVIVEFRSTNYLVAIVMNVLHNIPLDWPIQIFHGPSNRAFLLSSPTLKPHIASQRITLTELPQYTGGQKDRYRFISELLTSIHFWSLVRGEHVLVFQMDSVFCSNSPHKITDFLNYDYIGAPWSEAFAKELHRDIRVGNGGFSLRSRSKIRELIVRLPYNRTVHGDEDFYFSRHLPLVSGRMASVEVASRFSTEFEYTNSMGIHKPMVNHAINYSNLCQHCPEASLIPPFCLTVVIRY